MTERIEINLLPAEYRVHRKRLRLPREIVWPLVGVLLEAFCILWFTMGLDSKIAEDQQRIADTDQSIQANQHTKTEIENLQAVHRTIQEKIRALERISVDKAKWVRLLEILADNLPRFTWLTAVEERVTSPTESSLRLQASTFVFPEVADYMSKLTESEYIRAVDLSGIEQSGDQSGNAVFQFSLTAAINPDAGLARE